MGAVSTVLLAHAAAYLLTTGLPRTGIALLGISAADPAVLERYQAAAGAPLNYLDALRSLFTGDFRQTLDGVPTWQALSDSIVQSLPILLVSNIFVALVAALVVETPADSANSMSQKALELVAFFPPFLPGFALFSALVISGVAITGYEDPFTVLLLGFCVGASPACLVAAIVRASSREEMRKNYIMAMRARGYSEREIARAIRKAVLLPCVSSAEKVVLMQVSLLIFSEAIFSVPGFGSTLLLAVQRNDVNVLLLAVTLISALVALVRVGSQILSAGLDPRQR